MKFGQREHIITWAAPVVLAVVLVLLAILQLHWSRQASDAATTRMQASLQNSMMNFRLDLARQFATMCLEIQGNGQSTVAAKRLPEELDHWQRTTLLSGLIENIYEWDKESGDESTLSHFLPATGQVEQIAWPARFHKIHDVLETSGPDLAGSPANRSPAFASAPPSNAKGSDWFDAMVGGIDQNLAVLVVPASRTSVNNWMLVELNPQVLKDQIFPQLAERYFGDPRTSDYEIAVVNASGENPQVLYSSGDGFGENDYIVSDATLNLFGPPSFRNGPSDFSRNPSNEADKNGSTPSAAPLAAAGPAFVGIRFDPVPFRRGALGWGMIVRHRKGSVAAAVAELRFRNLELSFGVLLVLGASMALIIFNSQRARRLALLQMDFVAGVSHELRTPVAAILSISENIVDGVVEDEKQLLRYGGMIRNQAQRLHHLVEQVLRFAATQSTATSYTIRPLQISEAVQEVLDGVANLLAASGFKVEREIDSNLPPVRADFGVLVQCLENLITNAVKYGGEKKWIALRAKAGQSGIVNEVAITVEDHGIGIDDDELDHIFEPFYRSPKVAESQIPGTGLGLALARTFAEAMGGRLSVVSQIGRGTAFTLHLPAEPAELQKRSQVTSQPAQQGG